MTSQYLASARLPHCSSQASTVSVTATILGNLFAQNRSRQYHATVPQRSVYLKPLSHLHCYIASRARAPDLLGKGNMSPLESDEQGAR